jgi:hypothetical protein
MNQAMLLSLILCEFLHILEQIFLKFYNSITLATWALVIVTALLVFDGSQKGREQRERWKREDQSRRLQSLDLRFNSPGMIAARKRMANELGEKKLSQILGKPTPEIWPVIAFLSQVAQFCKEGLIEFTEADFAYRDYVMIIWLKYGSFLSEPSRRGQFGALEWWKEEMSHVTSPAAIDSELSAAASFVQDDFIEREANL